MPSKRPEHTGPADLYYGIDEASKYTSNSRIIKIQEELSLRALELLNFPDDDETRLILDVGCGSGLSGECISEAGHMWIGMDISQSMLDVAVEREVEGDLILADMGGGVPFRPGSFDGVISVSALQWLCNSDSKAHNPVKRLYNFFCSLYAAMTLGARAVFQVYPENDLQLELMSTQALNAGFMGGVLVDHPESPRLKKIFIVLQAGGVLQRAIGNDAQGSAASSYSKKNNSKKRPNHPAYKSRDWVRDRKDRSRRQGKEAPEDSKYTGRQRRRLV